MFEGPITEVAKKIKLLHKELAITLNSLQVNDFKVVSSKLLNTHLEIENIRWTQYTPHYNNGDRCFFSVNEPEIEFKDKKSIAKYMIKKNSYKIDSCLTLGYFKKEMFSDPLAQDFYKFSIFIENNEEIMEELFGDHVEVIISREAIDVDIHYHE